MDLYLCPRVRKKQVNIDPETLKPKLPSRKDLKPYPVTCYLEYKGHKGAVVSISTEASWQWIASVWVNLKEATRQPCYRTNIYDHHIYDLIEVGVENFKPLNSFTYDKKLAPRVGSKHFICFVGEGFESVEELKHLKEVLVDLLRGEVVENLNLAGLDHAYVCTAVSSNRVVFTHCALLLKKSGTIVPRMELVEIGPSMDFVVRRHRLPNESLRKEAMRTAKDQTKKKVKNVSEDAIRGKIGKIYIPDQKLGDMALPNKAKGVKRERREAKMTNDASERAPKKRKEESV